MARKGLLIRDFKTGKYVKESILNYVKYFCNKVLKWLK